MAYQLCLGDEPLSSVIDRIVDAATLAVPALDAADCRRLVELIFRTRMRQTDACGRHRECRPTGGLFAATTRPADGAARSAGWSDLDPHALPMMFGVTAASMADVAVEDRSGLERALAGAFTAIVAPLLAFNPRCGRSEICRSQPTYPLTMSARRTGG
jgi:hypothetical protein